MARPGPQFGYCTRHGCRRANRGGGRRARRQLTVRQLAAERSDPQAVAGSGRFPAPSLRRGERADRVPSAANIKHKGHHPALTHNPG